MKFHIQDAKKADYFINIFKLLKSFTESIDISVGSDGMYFQAMDSGHVCICETKLAHDWFTSIDVATDENESNIGVHTKTLATVLECRAKNSNQPLTILFGHHAREYGAEDKIVIIHEEVIPDDDASDNSESFEKVFEIPQLDLDMDTLNLPEDTEWYVDALFESSRFFNLIQEMNKFGEQVKLTCSDTGILFETSGIMGKYKATLSVDYIEEYGIPEDEEIVQNYNLRYLNQIVAFGKLSKMTMVNISPGLPIHVLYSEGSDDNSGVRFFLAPMLEDDD